MFDVEVYGCRFEDNSNESWNGVLWIREVQRARIYNSTFYNNFQRFGNGGALGFNEVTYADVQRCRFKGNEVGNEDFKGGNGGAINFYKVNLFAQVSQCYFEDNYA